MEKVITSQGIMLVGEAANRYITYKYFDSVLMFIAVIAVVAIIMYGMNKMAKF
jgi:hypothetical protein